MNAIAYAYVPKPCEIETCRVHVAFHGCEQGAAKIGDLYYTTTGYNELADTNTPGQARNIVLQNKIIGDH